MASKIVRRPIDGQLDLGAFNIPADAVAALPMSDATKNGVVLCDAREKFLVNMPAADGTHTPVVYTIGLYIAREPITADEIAAVEKAEKDAKGKAAEKAAKENETAQRVEREKRAAYDMGLASGAKAIEGATALAQTIAQLQGLGVKVGQ